MEYTQAGHGWACWKGLRTMHGFARLKLVGTNSTDGLADRCIDDAPTSLPFPSCMRDLPVHAGSASHCSDALEALDRVTFNFERLCKELSQDHGPYEGPRAA